MPVLATRLLNRTILYGHSLLIALAMAGCASFSPPENPPTDFVNRAEVQASENIEVSASILSDEETHEYFAARLPRKEIQPVWLRIDNYSDEELVLNPLAMDKDYFSPSEAAWQSRGWGERKTHEKIRYFFDQHIDLRIPAGESVSGFVYTNHDLCLANYYFFNHIRKLMVAASDDRYYSQST